MAVVEVLVYLYLPLWVPDRRNWKSALHTQLQLDSSWEEDEVTKNAACLGTGSLFLTGFLLRLQDLSAKSLAGLLLKCSHCEDGRSEQ